MNGGELEFELFYLIPLHILLLSPLHVHINQPYGELTCIRETLIDFQQIYKCTVIKDQEPL